MGPSITALINKRALSPYIHVTAAHWKGITFGFATMDSGAARSQFAFLVCMVRLSRVYCNVQWDAFITWWFDNDNDNENERKLYCQAKLISHTDACENTSTGNNFTHEKTNYMVKGARSQSLCDPISLHKLIISTGCRTNSGRCRHFPL